MCVCVLQVDLEPEGKVYIMVTLTGTFIDGESLLSFFLHSSLLSWPLSFILIFSIYVLFLLNLFMQMYKFNHTF